ncbi:MAG: threonine/serine exporter family protein, partial [Cruoricaptor ignavus]|nr:threonine/serine exporter family protein [Cruoricaptor ignavus]
YPEWAKFVFIGLATAGLSKIFDATHPEFFIAFVAAISGMFVRKIILEKKYNIYISWLIAAFVSTSVVNICRTLGLQDFHGALTACVLWLIPGVPLINGVLDILENHIVSGWAKVAMGFMMVFMIAVGFYLSLFLFGYGNTI